MSSDVKGTIWSIVALLVVLLIIYAIINNKIKERRKKKFSESNLPTVKEHLSVDKHYNIFLNNGKSFENVKFLGMTESYNSVKVNLPFTLCEWIVIENVNNKKIFIKPTTIKYYQEV